MIYTVTTVPFNFPHKDKTTVGFFETFQDAHDHVVGNSCDIAEEGYYRYAVIEEYESGIYMVPQLERWYEWSEDRKHSKENFLISPGYVQRLERPRKFRNVCCWGMS